MVMITVQLKTISQRASTFLTRGKSTAAAPTEVGKHAINQPHHSEAVARVVATRALMVVRKKISPMVFSSTI